MRALVVYESIFGNTHEIAEAIGAGLRDGLDVEIVEVGRLGRVADDIDLLVIGGPTHAWGMSHNVTRRGAREQARHAHHEPDSTGIGIREWLRTLRRARGFRLAAALDTAIRPRGSIPTGSAARGEAERLEELGYRLASAPVQFYVGDVGGPLEAGELERAHAWGVHLAACAKQGTYIAPSSRWRPALSIAALVGNLLGLLVIQLHDLWRPLTLGVVTADWARAVDTMSLACLVGVAGHVLLLMFRARDLPSFVACATAAANLAAAIVVYGVFPFDFGALEMGWFDPVFRLILLVALVGGAIGLVAQFVRLALRLLRA